MKIHISSETRRYRGLRPRAVIKDGGTQADIIISGGEPALKEKLELVLDMLSMTCQ